MVVVLHGSWEGSDTVTMAPTKIGVSAGPLGAIVGYPCVVALLFV